MLEKGYFPVKVDFYGFWYRRKVKDSRMNSINNDKKKAKEANRNIQAQAKRVNKFVKAVQYPITDRYNFTTRPKEFDFNRKFIIDNKGKNNILFILPWFVIGGVDKFQLDLISELNKKGYKITIVTTENSTNEWRQKAQNNCEEFFDLTTFLDRKNWASFLHYLIKSRNINLVFVQNSLYGYYVLPWLKSKFPELSFVDYVHVQEMKWRNGGFARESVNSSGITEKTYTCTNYVKNIMINDMGRKKENIETAYIGVDENYFCPKCLDIKIPKEIEEKTKNKKVLLFICRIVEEKRPLLMARIFKALNMLRDDLILLVVGEGPMLDWMKKEINAYNLNNKVLFVGAQKDTRPYYKISDITLIPSISEGLTITTYESLAMETPVITANVGGQAELVDTTVGKVIKAYQHPENDRLNFDYSKEEIKEYVDAVLEILNLNIEDYNKLKINCREKILSGYTIGAMTKKLEKDFRLLIENGIKETKKIDLNLAENYLVLFNELDRRYYEFPEDYIGMNKKFKDLKTELTLKEKLWSNPLYRGFIKLLQKLGIIEILKKYNVDKKMKKIYKKIKK